MMCSQHLMVTARRFTVIIEEKLLLKMLSFFGYGQTEAGGSLVECHSKYTCDSEINQKLYFIECRAGEVG